MNLGGTFSVKDYVDNTEQEPHLAVNDKLSLPIHREKVAHAMVKLMQILLKMGKLICLVIIVHLLLKGSIYG